MSHSWTTREKWWPYITNSNLLGCRGVTRKPFALSSETAIQVAQLADSNKVPVVVGHLLVFHSAVELLKRMLQAGELGTPYYLYSQRVNLGQVRPDENAL